MFIALSEEEKGVLRATCFVPLLMINPIATMSTLVVEIFDCHLSDMKRSSSIKFIKNYTIISYPEQGEKRLGERNQIEASAIGVAPAIGTPAVGTPVIGSSSSATEIRAVVIRVRSQLEYQFFTPEKTPKRKREGGNKKKNGKQKKAEPRTKKGKGEWQKKMNANKMTKEAEKPNMKKKQVTSGVGLEVVDDDVEVGREVNFNAISSEYGSDLLENLHFFIYFCSFYLLYVKWKKGDEKEVAKTDIVFFNQEKVVGEAYQSVYLHASADQTTVIYVEEQTLEVEKTKDEASQACTDQTTVVSVEEQTIKAAQTKVVISHQEEDIGKASQSKVDVTVKKRHALTEEKINKIVFNMACRMNQLHAHLDELLLGVLLESFIQRPIFQDQKNQVDQVWSLRKNDLSLETKKDNRITYMRIGEETDCLNTFYTLYPNQWLDNEVIDVYMKALI
ncbi:hypothetical protein GIB67_028277 [Kingdonia uniflora]|uniref:Uncharacterized protein n=1 Tax=Kingdonia uniflora TaxID=39325 RepID=A0A7J7KZB0_9MAGN|nr:hypothetical protein GIB67_028277 [Kingdonia uniflora]